MKIVRVLCFTLLLVSQAGAQGGSTTSDLNRPYQMKLGHLYALSLQQTVGTFMRGANWDAPVLTTYEEDSNVLRVDVLGGRSDIDRVKESVEDFRGKILGPSLSFLNGTLRANVDESQIRIIYTNRDSGKELLLFERGSYTLR